MAIVLLVLVLGNVMAKATRNILNNPVHQLSESLFQSSIAKGESFSYSPTSIFVALSMLFEGSTGKNKEELQRLLQLPESCYTRTSSIADLIQALNRVKQADTYNWAKKQYELVDLFATNMANSIWIDSGFSLKPSYESTLKKYFKSEANVISFRAPGSLERINAWVSEKTKGLISKLLDEISKDAVLMLINTIYFKAKWEVAFKKLSTYKREFFTNKNQAVMKDFMNNGNLRTRIVETEDALLLELKYKSGEHSMVIRLGKSGVSHPSQKDIATLMESNSVVSVDLHMPKLNLGSTLDLKEILTKLGVTSIFEPSESGWLKMISDRPLKVSKAIHKSKMIVDEEGTEAAAATIIEMSRGIAVMQKASKVIILNRPFSFAIVDQNQHVLFAGAIFN